MLTVITPLAVPSWLVTVRLWLTCSPAVRSLCAPFAVKLHAPFASTVIVPYVPATDWATTCTSPASASAIANWPDAFNDEASLLSVTAVVAELTVARSFVPVMLTVITPLAVPSALLTVMLSLTFWPAVNSSCAPLPV